MLLFPVLSTSDLQIPRDAAGERASPRWSFRRGRSRPRPDRKHSRRFPAAIAWARWAAAGWRARFLQHPARHGRALPIGAIDQLRACRRRRALAAGRGRGSRARGHRHFDGVVTARSEFRGKIRVGAQSAWRGGRRRGGWRATHPRVVARVFRFFEPRQLLLLPLSAAETPEFKIIADVKLSQFFTACEII